MMKKQITILIFVLLVLISGVGIVSAETLTGELGSDVWNSTNYDFGTPQASGHYMTSMYFRDIQKSSNFKSLIEWTTTIPFIDPDAPAGAIVNCNFRIYNGSVNASGIPLDTTGQLIGTGQVGYQRTFTTASPPVETANGYYWVFAETWDIGTLTGHQYVYIEYDRSSLYNITPQTGQLSAVTSVGSGLAVFNLGTAGEGQHYTLNKLDALHNSYTVSKPAGIGISGYVNKTIGGTISPSQIFIADVNHTTLSSQTNVTPTDHIFETSNSQIYICALSSIGLWYNSSLLFSPGSTTTTPTPTPTPSPTVTLGPGQFWLTFSAEDATTGGLIPGAEIDIYSEFSGTWDNATTSSGERTIATSQYHVYDAYGNASGYTAGEALDKIAYPNQNYLIKLFPSSGLPDVPGYVNLFVSVTERETGSPISGVSVSVNTPGSYTETGETDSTGTERFSTSNSSVKYITVSKTGYKSETRTITTPASGSYNAVLQMSRLTVTTVPTSYIPPGGVTPVRTVDPRSDSEKDIDMMNQIRDAGPDLIGLAIAVTFISLLGLMTKGFGK